MDQKIIEKGLERFSDNQAETSKPNWMNEHNQWRFEMWVADQTDPQDNWPLRDYNE